MSGHEVETPGQRWYAAQLAGLTEVDEADAASEMPTWEQMTERGRRVREAAARRRRLPLDEHIAHGEINAYNDADALLRGEGGE